LKKRKNTLHKIKAVSILPPMAAAQGFLERK